MIRIFSTRIAVTYRLEVHACVSTWLNGGVAPAQVAEWAGHSVAVLLRIYAKCIDGQHQIAKRRIEEALRETDDSDTSNHGDQS